MKNLEEVALVELAVGNNDQRAYSELVTRHQSNVRYSLRQLTNWNDALADDLTQDTFIQAFKELHRFRHQAKFSSWLYRIAYNVFLQYVRKKQLNTLPLEVGDDDNHQQQLIDENDEPDEHTEVHKKVASLLAILEPERRSVLHLFLHRQCTQQEIAKIMGIPLGTVKTHINRGRRQLQAGLQDWRN